MMTTMERKEVLFPDWRELMEEFEVFEVDTTELGNMQYGAAEGSHDDIVFSCCLGISACIANLDKDFEMQSLEGLTLKRPELIEGTWENYIYESLDIDPEEGF